MHIEGPVPAVMQLPRLVTFPFWKWTWKSCKAEVGIVLVPEVLFFFSSKVRVALHVWGSLWTWGHVSTGGGRSWAGRFGPDQTFLKGKEDGGFQFKVLIISFFKEEIIKVQLLWWKEVWHFPTLGSETICVFSWFQHSIPFAGTRKMVD